MNQNLLGPTADKFAVASAAFVTKWKWTKSPEIVRVQNWCISGRRQRLSRLWSWTPVLEPMNQKPLDSWPWRIRLARRARGRRLDLEESGRFLLFCHSEIPRVRDKNIDIDIISGNMKADYFSLFF